MADRRTALLDQDFLDDLRVWLGTDRRVALHLLQARYHHDR